MCVLSSLRQLLSLAVPVECAGCGRPDLSVCPDCRARLLVRPRPVRAPALPAAIPAWAGADYRGVVANAVLSWKERGRHDVSPLLGLALAGAIAPLLDAWVTGVVPGRGGTAPPTALLVPIPARTRARRERGEDLVRRLALQAGDRLRRALCAPGIQVVCALTMSARTEDQARLSAAQRRQNIGGAFRLRAGAGTVLRDQRCVVVDDILTTGSTTAEACRVLAAAGAELLGVATVCHTPRRECDGSRGLVPPVASLH